MDNKIINFALPVDLYDLLVTEATDNERTVSSQLRFILIQYFKNRAGSHGQEL